MLPHLLTYMQLHTLMHTQKLQINAIQFHQIESIMWYWCGIGLVSSYIIQQCVSLWSMIYNCTLKWKSINKLKSTSKVELVSKDCIEIEKTHFWQWSNCRLTLTVTVTQWLMISTTVSHLVTALCNKLILLYHSDTILSMYHWVYKVNKGVSGQLIVRCISHLSRVEARITEVPHNLLGHRS